MFITLCSALPTSINKMATSARLTRYVGDNIEELFISLNRSHDAPEQQFGSSRLTMYVLSFSDCLKGRCYNGECKTRENQCKYIWGPSKINTFILNTNVSY